jgi:simple sugar transport system permease protein
MTWELFAVFVGSSLRLAVPLLLAGTGELVSERAGVLNMSIEGMMLTGAFAAAVGAWATGSPVLALLICIVAVLPVALLQAFLSNTLRANQIVTGIGINILVLGATTLAYREIFGARSREQIPGLEKWSPPLLGDIPAFGEAVFQQVWLLYAGIAIIVLTALVLRYTSIGIVIHAAGAESRAVDKSGISVTWVRYLGVMFAGFMSALAGAFLSIGDIHTFTEGMTRGAGYLAIAAVIFGKWTLSGTILACLLFGGDGLAVSAPDARGRRPERASYHVALPAGVARGRWTGRTANSAARAWRALFAPMMDGAAEQHIRSAAHRLATRRDNFCKDRDRDLVGRDGAEIEAGRRLELRQAFGGNAPLRQRRFQRIGFLAATDERHIGRIDGECGQQGCFITAPLGRHDHVARTRLRHRQRVAFDTAIRVREGRLICRRRTNRHCKPAPPCQVGDRHGHRA